MLKSAELLHHGTNSNNLMLKSLRIFKFNWAQNIHKYMVEGKANIFKEAHNFKKEN